MNYIEHCAPASASLLIESYNKVNNLFDFFSLPFFIGLHASCVQLAKS